MSVDEIARDVELQELHAELDDLEDLIERMKDRAARLQRQIVAIETRQT